MEKLTFIAIPVNAAIIYFIGDSLFETSGHSQITSWLSDHNPEFWTSRNILLLILGVEHFLMWYKSSISTFIDDFPKSVRKAKKRRVQVKLRAKKLLDTLKNSDEFLKYKEVDDQV